MYECVHMCGHLFKVTGGALVVINTRGSAINNTLLLSRVLFIAEPRVLNVSSSVQVT